jgi:glycine cleavage system aminomethyltransferase T
MTAALGFLTVVTDGAPLASSPVEPLLRAAGARFEARGGWRVAVRVGQAAAEQRALSEGVAIADRSAMAKTEVLAAAGAAAADDGHDKTAG